MTSGEIGSDTTFLRSSETLLFIRNGIKGTAYRDAIRYEKSEANRARRKVIKHHKHNKRLRKLYRVSLYGALGHEIVI